MFPEMFTAAAGLGLSAFGAFGQASSAKQAAGIQQQMVGTEEQMDTNRQQLMELQGRRSQMEVLRNNQRARSLALNNATGSGSQFGSGLQGGYGQQQGTSGNNLLGIDQNLTIGRSQFALTSQLNQQKIALSGVQSTEATDAAIGGFGKSVLGTMGAVGRLFRGNTGSTGSQDQSYNNYGSYSTMQTSGFGGIY